MHDIANTPSPPRARRHNSPFRALVSLFVLGSVIGCVPAGKYDAAIADAANARSESARELAEAERLHAADQAAIASLRAQIRDAEARADAAQRDLEDEQVRANASVAALDEATALNAGLRAELERLGKNVDQLLTAKGTLSSSLEQARARLVELRRAQADADARVALLRDIALKLKHMIDADELQVLLRSGRMVLVLPNDVLFDSGKAEVKGGGKEALAQVAAVLATLDQRHFQVAGHTDDEPIRRSRFASNWELSTARGLAVVSFLVKSGMHPAALSAAGYAEFDPTAPNDSPTNRAKNRRTEITLQPNIDELVVVPDAALAMRK